MRRPAGILLSGQGLTLKNSWCCRQDASRTPCKQPAEGFSGEQSAFCHAPTLLFLPSLCNLIADPSGFATWGQCLVRCSEQQQQKKKNLKQTDNPQVGPVYPKVKEQAKANSLFSLQTSPRVRTREDNNRLWVSLSNHSFMEGEWWHGG